MKYVVWLLVLILLVAHQDNWLWDDGQLVLGFIPVGLFYHACISLAAGCVWFMATKFCWPNELDDLERSESASDLGEPR